MTELGSDTTFGFVDATLADESFILTDSTTTLIDAVKIGDNKNFGIGSLAAWKNSWVRPFCNKKNKSTTVRDDIGYNFINTLDYTSMMDQ